MEQIRDRGGIKGLKVVLILIAIFICIALLLNLLYSLPLKDSFLWYAGIFFCFYIPGNLLVRYIGFDKDEYFVNFFHSTALGTALVPLVYTIMRRLSHPEFLYVFVIVMFLFWFILNIHKFKDKKGDVYTSPKDLLSTLVLIGVVFILLHLSHFTDVVFLENGFKIRNVYLTETVFHLGIINVLRGMFPPIYPYASGVDFSHYHLNMHLEIELFNSIFSIDTLKLTFFYFPLLYFLLLVFLPYIFIRKYGGVAVLGVTTGILMFGSDFSFIPGLLGIFPSDYPWTAFFTPTIWSLFTLNGYLPALFVMFMCVFYLRKYYEDGRLLHLLIFALLGYSAYGFKSSMGPHIMGAAFLTGIASVVLMKDKKKGKILCVFSALTIFAIAFDAILFKGNAGNNILSIDPFNRFKDSLTKLGFFNLPWLLYFLFFPIYILITFGVRALGFYILKDVFKVKNFDSVVVFLIIFIVSGFLLSEFIYLGSPSYRINNAVWFSVQSLMAAWLLLSYFLLSLRNNKKKLWGLLIVIILLSAPATVQFLTLRYDNKYYPIGPNEMEIVNYLQTTQPRSVILHHLNKLNDQPSLASNFAGRQSVINLFRSFVGDWVGVKEKNNRINDAVSFFTESNANRSFILKQYKVDYVYAPSNFAIFLDNEPMLIKIMKNSEYVLYRVDRTHSSL